MTDFIQILESRRNMGRGGGCRASSRSSRPPSCEENDVGQNRHRSNTRVLCEDGSVRGRSLSHLQTGYGSEPRVLSKKRKNFCRRRQRGGFQPCIKPVA